MTDLLAARTQMAISLAFHIVFAAIGVGLPVLMVLAETAWLRTGNRLYLAITRMWAKGLAIFFAVGAVSGTVLSFELGLLWPGFMEYAGAIIGMPFSLEGLAFFTEAIFLGVYLYGWNRVSRTAHLVAGVIVALSGAASALFVLSVNGWMNAPSGFIPGPNGALEIDPIEALTNRYWIANAVHMLLASYIATGFGAASIHAWKLLREPRNPLHRKALHLALAVGVVASFLQLASGDRSAKLVHELQPAKMAAMEAQFETETCAPLRIGGIPDMEARVTRWAIEIPCALSFLAGGDIHTEVIGLDQIPEDEQPPVAPVHYAFQVMVGIGTYLAGLSALILLGVFRKRSPADSRLMLLLLLPAGALSFVAIQAGWIVTEVGRQPWIIQGVMRTSEAVTEVDGLVPGMVAFTALYVCLSFIVVYLLRHQIHDSPRVDEHGEWIRDTPGEGHA